MYLSMSITLIGGSKQDDKFFMLLFTYQHKEIYGKCLYHMLIVCTLKYKTSHYSLQKHLFS